MLACKGIRSSASKQAWSEFISHPNQFRVALALSGVERSRLSGGESSLTRQKSISRHTKHALLFPLAMTAGRLGIKQHCQRTWSQKQSHIAKYISSGFHEAASDPDSSEPLMHVDSPTAREHGSDGDYVMYAVRCATAGHILELVQAVQRTRQVFAISMETDKSTVQHWCV